MKKHSHLILGGARSGKSRFAEACAQEIASSNHYQLHYVATATACDKEMQQRIAHHQALRQQQTDIVQWHEHECPTQLAKLLLTFTPQDVVLIDCLTLWLNNLIFELTEPVDENLLKQQVEQFVSAVKQCDAQLLLVANEVGLGVIPMGEISRLFVDHAGWLNQKLASIVNQVSFIAAGLAMPLKNSCSEQRRG